MQSDGQTLHPAARDALRALLLAGGCGVLAVITGIEGPAYRNVGTMMAFFGANGFAGALSSGCIEADLALHAAQALETGAVRHLRYGSDSPFMDIRLPCGGALDIALYPNPPLAVLQDIEARRAQRQAFTICFDAAGGMSLAPEGSPDIANGGFAIDMRPELRLIVLGKGPEAAFFAGLAKASGYDHLLLSPEPQTLEFGGALGCETRALASPRFPQDVALDARTAVTLFFHDHEWEPAILQHCLASEAFYIGAQGSRRVGEARRATLQSLGVAPAELNRLRGPIGLIASARDPKTLAISVLAEILSVAERALPAQKFQAHIP